MQRQPWWRGERGQTATEYVLILSVLVLGILAAASALLPNLGTGIAKLNQSLTERFENNPLTHCAPGENCGGK
jgi:Flp pilus assembly pilin Flp